MKPNKIILVRHGQSIGNVDKSNYRKIPDYALDLTFEGRKQAIEAGEEIKKLVGDERIQFYVSPFWRTRRTLEGIKKVVGNHPTYEDARLREQEWGHLRKTDDKDMETERDAYGHFYFRMKDGESCADVYDRVSDFLNTLHRDFKKHNFPPNAVIVTHGMTLRVFLMRWFHMTVEQFELLANPKNCAVVVMELDTKTLKYVLKTKLPHHKLKHNYVYQKNA